MHRSKEHFTAYTKRAILVCDFDGSKLDQVCHVALGPAFTLICVVKSNVSDDDIIFMGNYNSPFG
ncbi:hypothetical protein D3C81_2278580 [compost metagenome]